MPPTKTLNFGGITNLELDEGPSTPLNPIDDKVYYQEIDN